ncbi:MAG: hypothetical protein QOD00_2516, partial [Blastocatellia bacterium]|nr:hypothetical protein [Blastocatellia bacterium]
MNVEMFRRQTYKRLRLEMSIEIFKGALRNQNYLAVC